MFQYISMCQQKVVIGIKDLCTISTNIKPDATFIMTKINPHEFVNSTVKISSKFHSKKKNIKQFQFFLNTSQDDNLIYKDIQQFIVVI